MPWSPVLSLFCFAIGVVAQQGIDFDPATTTRQRLSVHPILTPSPNAVVYSYSTPTSAATPSFSKFVPSSTDPLQFMPPAPHIHPPWSTQIHTRPTSARSKPASINAGAIAGGIVGGFVLVIAAVAAVFCFRSRRGSRRNRWKTHARGSWQDLEGKGAPLAATPGRPFDEAERPEPGVEDNYTKYVPRTDGKLSFLPKTVSPTFTRIMQHHSSGSLDPFADPQIEPQRHGGCSNDDVDNIEMKVNPSSPSRARYPYDMKGNT